MKSRKSLKRTALKPGAKPLKRTSRFRTTKQLAGGKALERRKKLKPVNRERRKRLDAEQYGEKAVWLRTLPCYVTGRPAPSVAAHVKSRGAGGKSDAMVPFHPLVELDWHAMPEAVFEAKYGVAKQDCKDAAERFEAAWKTIAPADAEQGE